MKRLILAFALLTSSALFAQTTTTITGTIKDLTGSVVTSGTITFTLKPSNDATMSGLARFTGQTVTCRINGSGLVKAQDGTSACVITQNTALQPSGSGYLVTLSPNNVKTGSFFMYAIGSSLDISTVIPTQTQLPEQGGLVDSFSTQTIGGDKTFTGATALNGGVTSTSETLSQNLTVGGTASIGGAVTIGGTQVNTNAGLFTNTQMNEYLQSLVGGCSASVEFHYLFVGYATDAIAGCVTGPVGGTVFEYNGISGYATTSSAPSAAVGVLGLARNLTSGTASATGGNFIGSDVVGAPNLGLYGVQADCNVFNAASGCHGILVGSFFSAQPAASVGLELQAPQGGSGLLIWGEGYRLDERATGVPSNTGAGIDFFPTASVVNSPSQGALHIARDPVSGLNTVVDYELANGNYVFNTSKAGTGLQVNGKLVATTNNATSGIYQTVRAQAGCTTPASIAGVCASPITVTWPVAFADTNYSVNCTPNGAATNLPGVPYVTAKATGTATVNYFAISAAAASWPSIDCEAIHD